MSIGRRELLAGAAGAVAFSPLGCRATTPPPITAAAAALHGAQAMYGLIGKMKAVEGQRDALIAVLLEGIASMPGCLSYIVARDPADVNAIWITEVWDSEASHKASLSLPTVKAAITQARPMIAGFSDHVVTAPVGGHGLAVAQAR